MEKLNQEQLEKLSDFFDEITEKFKNVVQSKHPEIENAQFEIMEVKAVIYRGRSLMSFDFSVNINEGKGFEEMKFHSELAL